MKARKALLCVALACGLVAPASGSGLLSPEQFAALHALVKPAPVEQKWEEIPWLTSLWEARKRAAGRRVKRPTASW